MSVERGGGLEQGGGDDGSVTTGVTTRTVGSDGMGEGVRGTDVGIGAIRDGAVAGGDECLDRVGSHRTRS
jgi:hypothetical protein